MQRQLRLIQLNLEYWINDKKKSAPKKIFSFEYLFQAQSGHILLVIPLPFCPECLEFALFQTVLALSFIVFIQRIIIRSASNTVFTSSISDLKIFFI